MIHRYFRTLLWPAMIALTATVAGCVHTGRHPAALYGRWQRMAVFPGVTLHTELHLEPDGHLTHHTQALLVTDGDTLCYDITAHGKWFVQRSISEFPLLQAEYDPATITRRISLHTLSERDSATAGSMHHLPSEHEAAVSVGKALPPVWDNLDSYLLDTTAGCHQTTGLRYPHTLMELTDTISSLTGTGSFGTTIRLIPL